MAYHNIATPAVILNREIALTRRFFARISAWFSNAFQAMQRASSAQRRFERMQSLQAKSDAELAALNIKRDDIVHHVFGDLYYV
ncbi:hypothetical protein OS190_06950 [Sulfitobacter sp. F26204]|uniref:hypothetical protein n=1 Tax=Sulfitobacter sp. F26204 TaxID=2996014 RepID=UPI00225E3A19|nr:hypothetical protein [Sulfitobacter sp. F26204]MCX7559303.1 hypothetical protein [Sulfitobacter sp. F26204]